MKKLLITILAVALISCGGESKSSHTSATEFKQYYGEIDFNNPSFKMGVRTDCVLSDNEVLACNIVAPVSKDNKIATTLVDETARVIAAFNNQPDHSKLISDSATTIDQALTDKEMKSMNKFGKQTYVNTEIKDNNVYVSITN